MHQIWSSSGFSHWERRELSRHKESQNLGKDRQENRKFWGELIEFKSEQNGVAESEHLAGNIEVKQGLPKDQKLKDELVLADEDSVMGHFGQEKRKANKTKQWKDVALTVSEWMAWNQQGREKPNQSCWEVWIFIFKAMKEPQKTSQQVKDAIRFVINVTGYSASKEENKREGTSVIGSNATVGRLLGPPRWEMVRCLTTEGALGIERHVACWWTGSRKERGKWMPRVCLEFQAWVIMRTISHSTIYCG